MLAPAFHTAAVERFVGSEGASVFVQSLTQPVATAHDEGVLREDLSLLAQDCVADLPLPVLSSGARSDDVDTWVPNGAVSGVIFVAVTRASWGACLTWWAGLEKGRASRFPRSLPAVPPAEKSPSGLTLPRSVMLPSLEALGPSQECLTTFVQPDCRTAASRG